MASSIINLGVNTDQFVKGFKEMAKNTEAFSETFDKGMNKVNQSGNKVTWTVEGITKEVKEAEAAAKKTALDKVFEKATKCNQKFNKELDETTKKIESVSRNATTFGNALTKAFQGIGGFIASKFSFSSIVEGFNKVSETVKDTEQAVSKLTAVTGGDAVSARRLFDNLNNLSREIPQSFDEITAAAINLNKTGIIPTNDNVKALASIALGTNSSLSTVAQAVSNAANGQVRGLQTLGIKAKAEGDKLQMTFQGVTETIDNNAQSIQSYMTRLANQKFSGTLATQMDGITGATKQLSEAWGDMYRAIGESGLGDVIADSIRGAVSALDTVTTWLKSPEVSQAIGGFARLFTSAFDTIVTGVGNLLKPFGDFFGVLLESGESTCKAEIGYFEGWFDFVRLGIAECTNWIGKMWEYAQAIGAKIGATFAKMTLPSTKEIMIKGSVQSKMNDYLKGQNLGENSILINRRTGQADLSAIQQLKADDPIKQKYEEIRKSVVDAHQGIVDSSKSLSDQLDAIDKERNAKINAKYDELIQIREKALDKLKPGEIKYNAPQLPELEGTVETGSNPPKGGRSGGGRSTVDKAIQDAQRAYDQITRQLEQARVASLSAVEKENENYANQVSVVQEALSRNLISKQEYYQTMETMEQEHQQRMAELQQQADLFIAELIGDPIVKLQDEYSKKLELLEEYHANQLVSEEMFLQARNALYDKYTADLSKTSKEKKGGEKGKKGESTVFGISTEELKQVTGSLDAVSNGFETLMQNMDESSGAYKALFAVQKGFSVASATLSCINAWANALDTQPFWPAGLAAYAQAVAMTAGIISQITSVSMHDKGGVIPSGEYGIVGEIGPELIRGPATVTSRKDTAELLGKAGGGTNVVVNLIEDSSKAGQTNQRETEEGSFIDIFVSNIRHGGDMANALESTYKLQRYGV